MEQYKKRNHSPSGSPHESYRALLPKGMSYTMYHRPRKAVRHISLGPSRSKSRDKYDAVVDRLVAMEDQEDRKAGGSIKLGQFTVCAIRGFGCHLIDLCAGTYGREQGIALRRQERTDKDHLRHRKLKYRSPTALLKRLRSEDSVTPLAMAQMKFQLH